MFIHLIVGLIVLGLVLWIVNTYVPMDGKLKQLVNVVAVVVAALWALEAFGVSLMGSGPLMTLIGTLIVLGFLLWVINTCLPIAGNIKSIINVVAVLGAVLMVLQGFGVIHGGAWR